MKNFFASKTGIIITGALIGLIAVTLQNLGNPPNMGVCVACFERDIAGALGLHRAAVVQYMRPEILGFVSGSFLISIFMKDFRPRGGSSSLVRFFLGIFAMIGALVFLGCPWRTLLRIAGGDWNAVLGLLGLVAGITAGVLFLKNGFNLGRAYSSKKAGAYVFPVLALFFFILVALQFKSGDTGALFFSENGPGSMKAGLWISAAAGIAIGMLAQRSRFCTMGALRDIILTRDFHLAGGIAALLISAFIMNIIFGSFRPGFEGQPIAHTDGLWNFIGMSLSGLAFALAGGCPGRQLILAGEGDSDAAVFTAGMVAGAALSHNFGLASSPAGVGEYGPAAVVIGLIFCLLMGFFMREKIKI